MVAMLMGTFRLLCHGVSGFGSPESQAPGSWAGRERGPRCGLTEPRGWFCPTPKLLCSGTGHHPASVYQALGGIVRVPGTVGTRLCLGHGGIQEEWAEALAARPHRPDGFAHACELASVSYNWREVSGGGGYVSTRV